MRILFISVSIQQDKDGYYEEPGMGSIAAYLQQKGNEVKVIRVEMEDDYISQVRLFKPDIVASSTYDNFFPFQMEIIKNVKNEFPNIKTMIGGYTATYNSIEIMERCPYVDYLIYGEGEIPTSKLIKALEEDGNLSLVGGLVYRDNGKIIKNKTGELIQDLDELPYLNRDILTSRNEEFNNAQLCTSRGCTGICTFCCSSSFWRDEDRKRVYRQMSPK